MRQAATKKQAQTLAEFLEGGLARLSSQWVNGSRKNTTQKTPPVFCRLVSNFEARQIRGATGKAIARLLKMHPRCEKLVIVDDVRAAKKMIRDMIGLAEKGLKVQEECLKAFKTAGYWLSIPPSRPNETVASPIRTRRGNVLTEGRFRPCPAELARMTKHNNETV